MRVLPLQPLADTDGFIAGMSMVRGVAVPVVDGAALFGETESVRGRLVAIAVGPRMVGLIVDAVIGVTSLDEHVLEEMPPLLHKAAGDVIQAIGLHDGEFLLRLETSRLLPETMVPGLGLTGSDA